MIRIRFSKDLDVVYFKKYFSKYSGISYAITTKHLNCLLEKYDATKVADWILFVMGIGELHRKNAGLDDIADFLNDYKKYNEFEEKYII